MILVDALFFLWLLSLGVEALLLSATLKKGFHRRLPDWLKSVVHGIVFLGLGCWLYAIFIAPFWFDVTVTTIKTPKLKRASFKIVQISDLHSTNKVFSEPQLIRAVNGLKPDIIAVTGDCVNNSPSEIPVCNATLARLNAPLGKFVVPGNHDTPGLRAAGLYNGTGFTVLEKDTVQISKGAEEIAVSGIGYWSGPQALGSLATPQAPQVFRVLLCHVPEWISRLGPNQKFDLVLAGHTHGGWIREPLNMAWDRLGRSFGRYVSGRYDVAGTILYVNRGARTKNYGLIPRAGFWIHPEISVFLIEPQ